MTVTSFEHSKWLSAGLGGLAVTDDPMLAEKLRAERDAAPSQRLVGATRRRDPRGFARRDGPCSGAAAVLGSPCTASHRQSTTTGCAVRTSRSWPVTG